MPELPDLEKFKTHLESTSLRQKIAEVSCSAKELICKISFEKFRGKLQGKEFESVQRRGKFLKERTTLYQEMNEVLKQANQIQTGSGSFDSYWLLKHRHQDMLCPHNKNHHLKKETIAGRSAIFCPVCQS